jgi:hypothetical protein
MPLHIDISGNGNGNGPDSGFVRDSVRDSIRRPSGGSPRSSTRSRVTAIGSEILAAIRQAFVVFGPVAPRTIVARGSHALSVSAERDSTMCAAFVVRNRQSATVVVSPALGILHGPEGVRWAPEHTVRVAQRLLSAGATSAVEVNIAISNDVPLGRYEGVLVWPGLVGTTPLVIDVRERSTS